MITRTLDAGQRRSRGPMSRAMRLRLPIVTLVIALTLGAAEAARGDELRVTQIRYLAGSGTIAADVESGGPPDTAVAIALYRHRCPYRPAETDVAPGASADGQTRLLLANPRNAGASGDFELCVWTIHEGGAIGARYERSETLPSAPAPAWNPALGTNHPWWWPFVGWTTLLLLVAAFAAVALSRGLIRRVRRRSGEGSYERGPEGARLAELQQVAAHEAARGAARAEAAPQEFDRVATGQQGSGHPASSNPGEGGQAPTTANARGTPSGHPFTPPAPSSPQPPMADPDSETGAEAADPPGSQ